MNRTIDVAVKGILLREGRALLVQRSVAESSPFIWELPGGKLEFGETPREALVREIAEETGLAAQTGRLLYAATFRPTEARQVIILVYAGTASAGEVRVSSEHQDARRNAGADRSGHLGRHRLRRRAGGPFFCLTTPRR